MHAGTSLKCVLLILIKSACMSYGMYNYNMGGVILLLSGTKENCAQKILRAKTCWKEEEDNSEED